MQNMRIAVLDIETTGRTPQTGTIVEIGIAMIDLRTHFVTKLFDSLCREPEFEMKFEARMLEDCWIFQNSTLTINDIRNAPKWSEVAPKIQRIMNKFPVTAYNKAFDFSFLKNRGIRIPRELPCPMIAATPVLKLPPRFDGTDYKWPSVEECWEFFFSNDHIYSEIHRAYDDAVHEAEIIYELFKRGAWKPIIS
ncbi:3'-5' exonuclease [Candidatus Harpocratesius sp.]